MARILWALLLLSACIEASVTAAWKIPVEHFAPDYKTDDKIRKLEEPPGESAFFQPGDELWDVSKALHYEIPSPASKDDPTGEQVKIKLDQPWYGQWLVWNARSGMVVACGSWNDIFAAQRLIRFDETPITIRTRVEVVTGDKDTLSVSLSAENGAEASAKENGLEVDVRATNMGAPGLVDGEFHVSWPAAEKDSRWETSAGLTLKEGVRTKLARCGHGPRRSEIFVTASREFSNGVKVSEARLIEGKDGAAVWTALPDGDPRLERLGEALLVKCYRSIFGPSSIVRLGLDPAKSPRIKVSAEHGDWIRGEGIDLGVILWGHESKMAGPNTLSVYDPGSDRYTIVGTAEQLDAFEAMINGGIIDPIYGPTFWIESNPEAGGWGLTCRGGEMAQISKAGPAGDGPSFKIEAGMRDESVELSYDFDILKEGKVAGHLKSSTTLEVGKPQEIAGHSGEGKEEKVILTVSEN